METGERVKMMRLSEGLSRPEMRDLTGIPVRTLENWEYGKNKNISVADLQKITSHERFEKYALWLMTGKCLPESGQVSPDINDMPPGVAG